MKKTYTSPELVVRGTIEEITQGSGWGLSDLLWGDGTIGSCFRDNSCDFDGS